MCPILCELCTANKTAGYNFIPAPAVRLEAGSSKSEYFHTLISAPVTLTVANLRGREGRHPGVQILSILCSFWEILFKIVCWRPYLREILDIPLQGLHIFVTFYLCVRSHLSDLKALIFCAKNILQKQPFRKTTFHIKMYCDSQFDFCVINMDKKIQRYIP